MLAHWVDLSESDASIAYSPVSHAELWAGALPHEHAALTSMFDLTYVSIDQQIGRRAGDYLKRYKRSHGVDLGGALIAASTVVPGALLWTRNRKQYPMKELQFFWASARVLHSFFSRPDLSRPDAQVFQAPHLDRRNLPWIAEVRTMQCTSNEVTALDASHQLIQVGQRSRFSNAFRVYETGLEPKPAFARRAQKLRNDERCWWRPPEFEWPV